MTDRASGRRSLEALRRVAFAHNRAGHPELGLREVLTAAGQHAKQPAAYTHLLAQEYVAVGDPAAAMAALWSARREQGVWLSADLLLEVPGLEPLHDTDEFRAFVAEGERLRAAAQAEYDAAHAELELILLAGPVEPARLLVTLHGGATYMDTFPGRWRPAVEAGWLVAIPYSGQLATSDGRFGWRDRERALHTMRRAFAAVGGDRFAPELRVLAGFSGGGRLAVQGCVRAEPFATAGFISVSHAPPEPIVTRRDVARAAARGVRGVFVAGAVDEALSRVDAAIDQLRTIDVNRRIYPGVGHAFPPSSTDWLIEALRFVERDEPQTISRFAE